MNTATGDSKAQSRSGVRIPFKDGFLTPGLTHLDEVRLIGSRCCECGIALFGRRRRCENCSSIDLRDAAFARGGVVHTFTIQRYPPPAPYSGPDPWMARPLAWVDLDENGPRILAPIDCAPDEIGIGARVSLLCRAGWIDRAGDEVVIYGFRLATEDGGAQT